MKKYILLIFIAGFLAACESAPVIKPIAVKRNHVLTGEYEHVAASDTPPVPILRKQPVYPAVFRSSKTPGKAVIYFVVDAQGVPVQVQYIEATDLAFAESAIKAVSQWRFKPALKNGVAVPACMTIPLLFKYE